MLVNISYYTIWECDAPWPVNEWFKLESTKDGHDFNIQNCKGDSKWDEGKDWLKAFPGLLDFFFCVAVVVSKVRPMSPWENEYNFSFAFFLRKQRHALTRLWFLSANLSLLDEKKVFLSKLPTYQPSWLLSDDCWARPSGKRQQEGHI